MLDVKVKKEFQSVVCDVCQGTGRGKHEGSNCRNCHGVGSGAFCDNKFYYWGRHLSREFIKWRHIRIDIEIAIDYVSYFIGLTGILFLLWWIWSYPLSNSFVVAPDMLDGAIANYDTLAFWRSRHWLILVFWFSTLADMFILYRLSQKKAKLGFIKKRILDTKGAPLNSWDDLRRAIRAKKIIDISTFFNEDTIIIIEKAFLAADYGRQKATPIDLFFSWLQSKSSFIIFSRLDVDLAKILEITSRNLPQNPSDDQRGDLSVDIKEILIEAYFDAVRNEQKQVDGLNLVMPILLADEKVREILYEVEIDSDTMQNVINWYRINDRLVENYRTFAKSASYKPDDNMDRAYTAVATPVLNHFSSDLTLAAKWGRLDLSIGRDKEIEDIFQAWTSGKFGVILIGPPGIGKRNIAGGIAQLMVKEEVLPQFHDKRLVELDLTRLLSGLSPEAAMERLMVVLDEVERAGNILLYIENVDNLSGVTIGSGDGLELAEVLSSSISKHQFYCIVTTTEENYVKSIEKTPLGNVLSNLFLTEPSGNQAINMIEGKIGGIEGKYRVFFSYGAIRQSVEQSAKYIHDKFLPEKALDILEAVAVKVAQDRGQNSFVNEEDIAIAISELTGVPITKVTADEGQELLKLEERMHERMIGQEEAVDVVAASLRRARVELREHKRPIASFLFLGPTGVGKTELAKTVAEVYFGREDYMIRMDMSEYQLPDSVDKMIGNVHGEQGYLTEAVRKLPFSLVLLDEIEKAHPDILNLFLQVMDDGRLTDGQGRTIDFTNCIIIATSNAGSLFIQEQISAGTSVEDMKHVLIDEHLVNVMRPELINRFDGIIVFKPLQLTEVAKITRLMLGGVSRMLDEKGIILRADEVGILKIAAAGFDPKFGARPLRRLIQDKVENVIANMMLAGQLERRDTVVIDSLAQIKIEKGKKL